MAAPVALKAYGARILHKTEAGAVALALPDPSAVEAAARAMAARLRSSGLEAEGFLVQRMAGEGVEMIVGVVQDPQFGPVIACGAGGTAVELLKDVSVRLTPLTDSEADGMIRGLATFLCWTAIAAGRRRTSPHCAAWCSASGRWRRTCPR